MKKIFIISSLVLVIFLICGCEDKTKEVIINGKSINTSSMEHKHCTREATAENAEVKLEYDLYYTGSILNLLKSKEEIISADDSVLNTYEEAYKKIHANYEGLENYDTNVARGDTTVISTININYDKIDIERLLNIEGEEDNIFENNVPLVSKWLELAEKFGTKCELVED
jgi:uncharacterized lipoprotein YehR (DUF1307 family)